MGTIVFIILVFVLRIKASPNDYQWLCLLISVDTIAVLKLLKALKKPSDPKI